MRKPIILLISMILFMMVPLYLLAKEKPTVAVLPFSVHSAENIDYIQQGIMDMLSSRISANEQITVASREKVLDAIKSIKTKDFSPSDINLIGKKLNTDYVVRGSITKIGNSISIDGKLIDIAASKSTVDIFTQSQGMDDVITKINDFAQRINQFVMGGPPATMTPATAAVAPSVVASGAQGTPTAGSREAQIIAGIKSGRKNTFTGSINPDFISGTQSLDRKGFWMSLKYPTEFKGMDIGDVNGDGLNEIVTIDNNNVYIFQKKGNDMVLLQKVTGISYDKYVGVDLFSLTGNSYKDIIVSNVFASSSDGKAQNTVQSFILTWKDGKYVKVADRLPWLFRVVGNSGNPILLGQELSAAANNPSQMSPPFESPINEMVWRNGKVAEGKKMRIPRGLCLYGLTIDDLGEGKNKIIALNAYDHLYVYEETDKLLSNVDTFMGGKEILYKSEEVYGGGNTALNMYGQDPGGVTEASAFNYYLNPRILAYDINKTGKREVFIARNDSPGGRLLQNVKIFTSTEFCDLYWDSLGLSENWRTKKLSGYAADYQIKDVDNDGEDEIVIALVTSSGSMLSRTSVIIAYKLRAQ
ncbi:MAG: hypothetical protein CSYNP_01233 [Syntrophus sp. SKADARSKE-3]|nr:hypothetical protein [Syntrophus sp. SKADARSKE-3]